MSTPFEQKTYSQNRQIVPKTAPKRNQHPERFICIYLYVLVLYYMALRLIPDIVTINTN